jgi:enamine deaminase RidA (YjgF/YER057c/UK114 family)
VRDDLDFGDAAIGDPDRVGISPLLLEAALVGDMIYLSGVVVGQREGESLESAYDRTYRRIGAILTRARASWDDVVDITTYHEKR